MSGNDGYELTVFSMADYDEVMALWTGMEGIGVNPSDEREPMIAYLERNPGLSLVARADGRLVAAVLCGHDGRRGYLHHLAVHPEHRGRGLGRRMVTVCLEQLAALGIPKCNAFLYADNDPGERFWQAVGFAQRVDLKVIQRVTG